MNTQKIIWHYTHCDIVMEILETGLLKVSDSEKRNKVKPPGI